MRKRDRQTILYMLTIVFAVGTIIYAKLLFDTGRIRIMGPLISLIGSVIITWYAYYSARTM